jgi:hypothetical protein
LLAGDVGLNRGRLSPQVRDLAGRRLRGGKSADGRARVLLTPTRQMFYVGNRDVRSGPRERQRDSAPDTASTAGDERDSSFENVHDASSCLLSLAGFG